MPNEKITKEDILDAVREGFAQIEGRMDTFEGRMGTFEEKMVTKEYLDQRLEEKLNEKFDEKLAPIIQDLFSLKQDFISMEKKLDNVINANNEDILVLNSEIEKLKKQLLILEDKVRFLEGNKK